MINKKRFAFTMAEIMVVLAVIGLVLIAAYQVSRVHKDKATQYLYYGAFQHLKTIGSEVYVASSDKMLPKTDTELCNSIAKLVNTVGAVDCSLGTESAFIDTNLSMVWSNGMRYFNFRPKGEDCRTSTKSTLLIISAQDFIDCIPQDGTGTSGKTYKLVSDIDFAGVPYTPKLDFAGTLDGDFYKIKNLVLNNPKEDSQALFGNINAATMKNIILTNFNVTGARSVGALIGYSKKTNDKIEKIGLENSIIHCEGYAGGTVGGIAGSFAGTIKSCYSTAQVSASASGKAGGLAGEANYGSVDSSYATGTVSSETGANIGGLIGTAYESDISSCYATGNVSTNGYGVSSVGGLIGASAKSITSCFATGNVFGKKAMVGGLAGNVSGSIITSYATGNVEGQAYSIGGLVGSSGISKKIESCYSRGNVNGNESTGGLVGGDVLYTAIKSSYSTGRVTGSSFYGGLLSKLGGGSSVTLSFWDQDASGIAFGIGGGINNPGVVGKTTAQMKTPSTFTSAGWDTSVWNFVNGQYPTLKNMPPYTWDQTVWDISKYPAENPTFKMTREEVEVPETDAYSIAIDINGGTGKSEYDKDVFKFDVLRELGLIVPALGSLASESGRFLSVSVRYEDFSSGNRVVKWLAKNIGYRQAACITGVVPSAHEYCKGKGSFTSNGATIQSPAYVKRATCTPQAACEIVINKP